MPNSDHENSPKDPVQLTLLIQKAASGDPDSQQELMQVVGSELHRLAAHYMRGERGEHILQPTALVNEMFIRLFCGAGPLSVNDRGHFFAVAAKQMRQILVDYARSENAGKRNGIKVEFNEIFHGTGDPDRDLIALDDALKELEIAHPECKEVVELRFFGGYTYEEIADIVGRNVAKIRREWEFARPWLYLHTTKA